MLAIDCQRPPKLYRYSERIWLERSLRFGEFRLRPAKDYKDLESDTARRDDELVRVRSVEPQHVTITHAATGREIKPLGPVTFRSEINTNYLVLCFAKVWDKHLFDGFPGTDSCLVIHESEEFCEQMHSAVKISLPNWIGVDAAVTYGGHSPFGAVYSKPLHFFPQQEWRFAWLPPDQRTVMQPLVVSIGNIERLAEIREMSVVC